MCKLYSKLHVLARQSISSYGCGEHHNTKQCVGGLSCKWYRSTPPPHNNAIRHGYPVTHQLLRQTESDGVHVFWLDISVFQGYAYYNSLDISVFQGKLMHTTTL